MNIKLTSLLAGAALLGGVGVANAEGPLQLTEAAMDGITAGTYDVEFYKYVDTNVQHTLEAYKYVDSTVHVYGQLADAEAAASCFSYNCLTETLTVTSTSPAGTTSYSESISATSDGAYYFFGGY